MKSERDNKRLIEIVILLLVILSLLVSIIFVRGQNQCTFINIFLLITIFILSMKNKTISKLNKELKLISEKDFLTNTYNRRFLNSELLRACENKEVITFLMVDVDDFKVYNDKYGHVQGDKTLRIISKALIEVFSKDIVCRYGGEEFSIVSRMDKKEVVKNIKKFMRYLNNLNIIHEGSQVSDRITVSIGIESRRIVNEDDIYNLVKEADKNLYLSKFLGKNRYTL